MFLEDCADRIIISFLYGDLLERIVSRARYIEINVFPDPV
jgi:hypothetical protein